MAMMRAAAANQGYLKYASGYPLTLTKTLAKPPENITVYGNAGGVGDYDSERQAYKIPILLQGRNLLDMSAWSLFALQSDGSYKAVKKIDQTQFGVVGKENTVYTLRYNIKCPTGCNARIQFCYSNGTYSDKYITSDGTWKTQTISSTAQKTIVGVKMEYGSSSSNVYLNNVMLVEGSYTAETMPPYEPYINKTIILYSDSALGEGDYLTVNPKTKTATRGENTGTDTWTTTDVSALQNWSQDWKLPKSEELTVTAGTTVLPSNMDMAYMSKTETDIDKLLRTVRKGNMSKYAIGSELMFPWTDKSPATPVPYNAEHIVAHHGYGEVDGYGREFDGLFLQWKWATPYNIPFNERQALYTVDENGLAARTYYFTLKGFNSGWNVRDALEGKTVMFTLPTALTAGQQLLFIYGINTTDITATNIRVYNSCYATEQNSTFGNIAVSEWDGESGLPLSGDAANNNTTRDATGNNRLNHIQICLYGYNRWSQSAYRQYLNSTAGKVVLNSAESGVVVTQGWWKPQSQWDRMPSSATSYPGFLSGYTQEFINAMRTVKVKNACNTVCDGGIIEYTYDKVFLPSLTQMRVTQQASEGYVWDYYTKLFVENERTGTRYGTGSSNKYDELKSYDIASKSSAVNVRLRSAHLYNACYTWYVFPSGYVSSYYTTTAYRARPACIIG